MRGRGSRSGEGRIRGYGNGEKGARSRMKRDGHGCYKANFLAASEAFLRTRALEDQTASDLLRIGVLRSWGAGRHHGFNEACFPIKSPVNTRFDLCFSRSLGFRRRFYL